MGPHEPNDVQKGQEKPIENSPEEENLEVMVNKKLGMIQQCALSARKANSILSYIRRGVAAEREVIVPFCSALVRPHLEHSVQVSGPRHKSDAELLRWVHRKAMRMAEGLEHLSY